MTKKLGRKSVLVDAERYEILIDRNLKTEFVNQARNYSRGPAELIRDFMRAFIADPVRMQKYILDRSHRRTTSEDTTQQ